VNLSRSNVKRIYDVLNELELLGEVRAPYAARLVQHKHNVSRIATTFLGWIVVDSKTGSIEINAETEHCYNDEAVTEVHFEESDRL